MKKIKILNVLTTGILFYLTGIFISILIPLKIIPSKYLTLIAIIYGLILGIIFIITIEKKKLKKLRILIMTLSLIIISFLGAGLYYLNSTIKFMNQIQSKDYQIEEYYVVVLKKNPYQTLSDIENKTIAIYQNNIENYLKSFNHLKKEISLSTKEYSNYQDACNALLSKEIDSIYISSSYKAIADEEIKNFKENTRILKKKQLKIETQTVRANKQDITTKSFNIYISGIDIAGDISQVSRSDVNMLVTVNPTTHKILLTSIPRDYYVRLHGTTGYKDKLTHSGIYGIDMTINTVEDLLDTNIDYYVRVNFTTLINVVDAIGGIDVYSDKAFRAWTNSSCSYQVGMMHLDGKCALAFARERYAYQEGDRHRIKNQQDVVIAILNKILSSKTLITKYSSILKSFSNSFQTNIPTTSIYELVNMQLNSMPSWNIEQIRLDGYNSSNYTYSYAGQHLYVMEPNQATIDNAKQRITEIKSNNN